MKKKYWRLWVSMSELRSLDVATAWADQRAHTRGLTAAAIDRERDDDHSEYWEDFRAFLQRRRDARCYRNGYPRRPIVAVCERPSQ